MPLRHRNFQTLKVDVILSIGLFRVPCRGNRVALDAEMAGCLECRFYAGFVNFYRVFLDRILRWPIYLIFSTLQTPEKTGEIGSENKPLDYPIFRPDSAPPRSQKIRCVWVNFQTSLHTHFFEIPRNVIN